MSNCSLFIGFIPLSALLPLNDFDECDLLLQNLITLSQVTLSTGMGTARSYDIH